MKIAQIAPLDRRKVRGRFEQRFSATRMAQDYADLYRVLLEKSKPTGEFDHLLPLQADETRVRKLGLHLA